MGFGLHVHLFSGFKLTLSDAFESGLLSADIMEDDDYQLIDDENYRDEIVDRHYIPYFIFFQNSL